MKKSVLVFLPLFSIFLCIFSYSFATTRGISVVSKHGQKLYLYKDYQALVIGVSNYERWPKLPNASKDAVEVAHRLKDMGIYTKLVIDPTYRELKTALTDLIYVMGREANRGIIFYYAGHGETETLADGRKMGYIIPKDCPLLKVNPRSFSNHAVSMREIESASLKIRSKHVLMLFDSCFSGALFALVRAVPHDITEKSTLPVRQFITAGREDEEVPDQSMFKRCLLIGLEGDADLTGDGYITGSELGMYLSDKVVNYTNRQQHPQYGKINNPDLDRGDFIFSLDKSLASSKKTPSISTTPESQRLAEERADLERKRRELDEMRALMEERKRLDEERKRLETQKQKYETAKLTPKTKPLTPEVTKILILGPIIGGDFADKSNPANKKFRKLVSKVFKETGYIELLTNKDAEDLLPIFHYEYDFERDLEAQTYKTLSSLAYKQNADFVAILMMSYLSTPDGLDYAKINLLDVSNGDIYKAKYHGRDFTYYDQEGSYFGEITRNLAKDILKRASLRTFNFKSPKVERDGLKAEEKRYERTRLTSKPERPLSFSSEFEAKEIWRDEHFIAYDNGTVLDTKTNLMWAAKDNGTNCTHDRAKAYCEKYHGGGFMDWRMPTVTELKSLYDKDITDENGHKVIKCFDITSEWVWATKGWWNSRAVLNFKSGSWEIGKFDGGSTEWNSISSEARALPVRDRN